MRGHTKQAQNGKYIQFQAADPNGNSIRKQTTRGRGNVSCNHEYQIPISERMDGSAVGFNAMTTTRHQERQDFHSRICPPRAIGTQQDLTAHAARGPRTAAQRAR